MAKKYFSWWRAAIVVATVLTVAALWKIEPSTAQVSAPEQATASSGQVGTVEAPIVVNAAELPVYTGPAGGPTRMREERFMIDKEHYESLKRQAALPGFGPQLPVTSTLDMQTPGAFVDFEGDTQNTSGCGSWVPADQALAVGDGANPILQGVNECLSVWSPAGTRLLGPVSLQSFFGRPASDSVCDPRALFDWKNHRFIVMAINCNNDGDDAYYAVSTADSAVGSWFVYSITGFSNPGAFMDYPRLGQDHSNFFPGTSINPGTIYSAFNLFNPGFVGEEWHVLPKQRMYAGLGFSFWVFSGMQSGGQATDSTQPANVWSPYEKPRAEFLITSKNNGTSSTALTVWAISNPMNFNAPASGNNPQLTGVVINAANAWTLPPNAPQSGGPNTIDTLDNRITGSATYAHGFLHAAHSTANGAGGTATLLYKIQPILNLGNTGCTTSGTGNCAQITNALIRNESIRNTGGTSADFMAVPQPDLEGNVAMVFNHARTDIFPSIAYTTQRVSNPVGQLDNGIILQSGIGRYTSGRWGDYMAVAPVGVAYQAGNAGITGNNAMVFSGMYSDSTANNRWRTRIGAVVYSLVSQDRPEQQFSIIPDGAGPRAPQK